MDYNQKGAILIIVVWLIAIIGIIATFLFYRTEAEWASVVNSENKQHFSEEAEAVLHERLALLVKDETAFDTLQDPWYGNGRFEVERNGFKITVMIEDEGSKPNLNTISDNGLQQVLQLAVSSSPSQTTADQTNTNVLPQNAPLTIEPVLDWRDIDDSIQRAEGAKLNYYQGLNPPYKIRNGCFSLVAEVKLVKNGDKLYPLLAPEVTVFGRINPNTINGKTFARLIGSTADVKKSQLETITEYFDQYRAAQNYFTKVDDLLQAGLYLGSTFDQIKPLFQFTGSCNVNLATKNNLMVALYESEYDTGLATTMIARQKGNPFENILDVNHFLAYNENQKPQTKKRPDDYFTTTSTIIRYRIWVTKSSGRYFLDTVWERQLVGLKKEWQIQPLSWRVLLNKATPEIPIVEDIKTKNDQNK